MFFFDVLTKQTMVMERLVLRCCYMFTCWTRMVLVDGCGRGKECPGSGQRPRGTIENSVRLRRVRRMVWKMGNGWTTGKCLRFSHVRRSELCTLARGSFTMGVWELGVEDWVYSWRGGSWLRLSTSTCLSSANLGVRDDFRSLEKVDNQWVGRQPTCQ